MKSMMRWTNTINWLRIKAEAENTTPDVIIRGLVSKEISATSA